MPPPAKSQAVKSQLFIPKGPPAALAKREKAEFLPTQYPLHVIPPSSTPRFTASSTSKAPTTAPEGSNSIRSRPPETSFTLFAKFSPHMKSQIPAGNVLCTFQTTGLWAGAAVAVTTSKATARSRLGHVIPDLQNRLMLASL